LPKLKNVFSGRGVAKLLGVNEITIRRATEREELFRIKKGKYKDKYDIEDPRNKEGMQLILSNSQSGDKRPQTNKSKEKKKRNVIHNSNINSGDISNEKQNKNKLELDQEVDIEDLDNIGNISDLRILKEREAIREKQLKNREMRGELVDRKNVSFVFNKLWSIDSSQLTTLGSKLSPEIASICSVDDPIIITKIRTKIDDEIYKTLGHCQRLLMECLGKIGADNLEEE